MKKLFPLTAFVLVLIISACKKTDTATNNNNLPDYTGTWSLNGQPFGALSVLNPPAGELDFDCDSGGGEKCWMNVVFPSGSVPTTSGTIPLSSAYIEVSQDLVTNEINLYNQPFKSNRNNSAQSITVTVTGNKTTIVVPTIWVYASLINNQGVIDSFPFSANVTFLP